MHNQSLTLCAQYGLSLSVYIVHKELKAMHHIYNIYIYIYIEIHVHSTLAYREQKDKKVRYPTLHVCVEDYGMSTYGCF